MRVLELGSTPCSKMTEERSRPVNGDLSDGVKKHINDDKNGPTSPSFKANSDSDSGSSISGGRLKFFKDGKFILELSHYKEGERTCWIPVPKKTFWPAVGTPKQECCTSLSVSDDNSSVQSSPWQRDHCWKQNAPARNAGRGLEFMMMRWRGKRRLKFTPKSVRRKRRRPYDISKIDWSEKPPVKKPSSRPVLGINAVIQTLWERVVRADPGLVSPRKRILREMERVTLEDGAKRQRARPGAEPTTRPLPANSHSITAILSREDEPSFLRSLLRSSPPTPLPHPLYPYPAPSPSYYTPTPHPPPTAWAVPYHLRHPYPLHPPTYSPVSAPPWSLGHYQPVDLKREDCSSDMPLNLSKDAG